MTTPTGRFVGLDVSTAALDAHLRPGGTSRRFGNTPGGIAALLEWVRPLAPARVVLEATGGYENAAVAAPSPRGLPVGPVNPRRIRDFARAPGRRAETDTPDAGILAESADEVRPPVGPLAGAEAQKLQALLARRCQLVGMRAVESNRLAGVTDRDVRRSIEAVLRVLGRQVGNVGGELASALRSSDVRRAKDELPQSTPGIGPVVGRTLPAELPELGTPSREPVASLAGVAPMDRDSGSWVGRRMIAGGRALVRSMLYPGAHAAGQGNAVLRAFAERLGKAGKAPEVIRIAVARKRLVIANAVLRDQRPRQPNMA